MLYWIWAGIFALGAMALVVHGYRCVANTIGQASDTGPGAVACGYLLAIVGLLITHPVHIVPAFAFLSNALPNSGEYINSLTSGLLVFAGSLVLVLTPNVIAYLLFPRKVSSEMFRRLTSVETLTID